MVYGGGGNEKEKLDFFNFYTSHFMILSVKM